MEGFVERLAGSPSAPVVEQFLRPVRLCADL